MEIPLAVVQAVVVMLVGWRLTKKTGYPGWYSILFLIPVVNLALLILLAFWEWPIEAEINRYKQRFGELPVDPESTSSPCRGCGTLLPAGTTVCPDCGRPSDPPDQP